MAFLLSVAAVQAHLAEYIIYDAMLVGNDQIEVELSTNSLSEIGLVQFNYADGSFTTYTPTSNGTFDPGTSGGVVSITINGQTVSSGSSGTVVLPSGTSITLEVN